MKKFDLNLEIIKEPKRNWIVIIATNRSVKTKPIVITRDSGAKKFKVGLEIEGYRNYLELGHTNIESAYLNFYFSVADDNNILQVYKCERFPLLQVLASPHTIIKIEYFIVNIKTEVQYQPTVQQSKTLMRMQLKTLVAKKLQQINAKMAEYFRTS